MFCTLFQVKGIFPKKIFIVPIEGYRNYLTFIFEPLQDYGVYLEDNGHTLRGLFIIDDKGVLRQVIITKSMICINTLLARFWCHTP